MTERERLIKLLDECIAIKEMSFAPDEPLTTAALADYLMSKGVICPPCKVGDVVYIHDRGFRGGGVNPYQITNLLIAQNKKGKWTKKYRAMWIRDGKTVDSQFNFDFADIGTSVFLTREEAEAALAERRNKRQENWR